MTKPALIIITDVCIVLALSLVQIIVSNHLSTTGIYLDKVQAQAASLEKQNVILQEKIYTDASYTTIASAAAAMGFVEKPGEIVFTSPLPLAIK